MEQLKTLLVLTKLTFFGLRFSIEAAPKAPNAKIPTAEEGSGTLAACSVEKAESAIIW